MKKYISFTMDLIGTVILFAGLYALLLVGSAYEDQKRCDNGAEQFCVVED